MSEPAAGQPAAGESAAGEPAVGETAAGESAVGEPAAGERAGLVAPEDDAKRLDRIEADLGGVDAALRHLDDGTYGLCEVCGIPVPSAVLEADVLAGRCPDHPR